VLFALRFSLDAYTDWANSPSAALLFWACFTGVVLLVIGLMWGFRRVRPH